MRTILFTLALTLFAQSATAPGRATGKNASGAVVCSGTVPSGAVANWSAAEGTGTTFADSVAGNTMTVGGGSVAWGTTAGVTCSVPTFSGGSYGLAASGTATGFTSSQTFSLSTWIYVTAFTGAFDAVVGNFDGTNGWILGLAPFGGSTSGPDMQLITPGGSIEKETNFVMSAGNLYNIVVTYDGSSLATGVTIYVNGTTPTFIVNSNTLTGHNIATTQPVEVANCVCASIPMPGKLFGTVIWNRVLTSTEATAIYSSGVVPPGVR